MEISRYITSLACVAAMLLPVAGFAQLDISISDGDASLDISTDEAPPPLQEEDVSPAPDNGYIWTPGYWSYDEDAGYYWVPGVWVLPPVVGVLWTPGYWGWREGYYVWNQGYWGPHVGYYGGINYGYGYFGHGYAGGGWNNGVFVNRPVTNYITHVNNVSFNGPGGVNATPTRDEQIAARERHFSPTSTQINHWHASQRQGSRGAVNQGHQVVTGRGNAPAYNAQSHPQQAYEGQQHTGNAPAAYQPHVQVPHQPQTVGARPAAPWSARSNEEPFQGAHHSASQPQPQQQRPQAEARPQPRPAPAQQPHEQQRGEPDRRE